MAGGNRREERESWGNWFQFVFAFLGSMVGYGNIWRFPYVCYRNGGGAFLIPFFVTLFICGIPAFLLDTMVCQYSSYGPARVWEVCPLFKGVGFSQVFMTTVVSIYYTMIMAWTLYYLIHSFYPTVPWSHCDNAWNTDNCAVSVIVNASARNNSTVIENISNANKTRIPATEEFWFNQVLDVSPSIQDTGFPRWGLVLALLGSWVMVFLCLVKGIKGIGKIAYVAASLPYVILTCLLIRGCLLPGSGDGLYYFLVPKWHLLAKPIVWRDAATQVFYSLGIGGGIIGTLSSYNKFNNNCFRDSIILPIMDALTCLFSGLVIFSYLGYMAYVTDKPMDDVVAQGPGLVFMAYPAALATLPLPQLWSVLFFLMLFTMGLDSQFCHVEVTTTALLDFFPKLLSRKKWTITLVICVISFVLGLPLTTQAGVYILNLMDWYLASIALLLTCALQNIALAWIYGTDKLYDHATVMIGYKLPVIFMYAWKFVVPAFVLSIWISGFAFFQPISAKLKGFNLASDVGGILLGLAPFIVLPGIACWEVVNRRGTLLQRLREATKPTPLWRPSITKENGTASHDNHEQDRFV